MKKVLLISLISVFLCFIKSGRAICQNQKVNEIEINSHLRFDNYPPFSYTLGGRPNTDNVNIKGISFGTDIAYRIPVSKSLFLKPALGYYRYSFNEIMKDNTSFGKNNFRDINFVSPLLFPFVTDRYHYNSLAVSVGLEKVIFSKKDYRIVTGLNMTNFFTFSQYYHLTLNPNPDRNQNIRKKDKRYFGTSFVLNLNLTKKISRVCVGPSLIIPVFDIWRTDEIFPEETNNGKRYKWSNGIGIGISCSYSLK